MTWRRTVIHALNLPRGMKKGIVVVVDILLCITAAWLAFCLRFEELLFLSSQIFMAAGVSIFLVTPIFALFGLYRAIFRYSGWYATLSLIKAVSIYFVMYVTLISVFGIDGVPRSVGFIQPILLFMGVGATRLLAKYLLSGSVIKSLQQGQVGVALIYGAGSAGRQIASGLRQAQEIRPFGFVDDDPRLWRGLVNGLHVYSPNEVPDLVRDRNGITDILLAIPSASRIRQKEILTQLSTLPVHVRILPGLSHLANGDVKVEDIREVEVDDLLGRDVVQANEDLLCQNITGKVVLVTGAGGSIGSELCRQIIAQKPQALILFEQHEFALYSVERELAQLSSVVKIIPVLGSVLDFYKLNRVISQFHVQTVYHAAAYKHVPMIEMNPAAGVWNNVFGTLRTVDAACHAGVETFVLVSTDKAVRPTNVMGCSKRISELILQAKSLQKSQLGMHATKLTMVRFGNVLGSSGSVIPVFREQIKNGGPVTVTHPEIIRYFMTIPEAAQLVIQAGAIGEGGDVMVLDMGEPVKIVDLAKRMIHLSGFSHKDTSNLHGDIEIQFTGLRPGEKLYEELLIGDNTLPTSHPQVMRAIERSLSWDELETLISEMEVAIKTENSKELRTLLKKTVPEFNHESRNGDILK